MSLIYCPECGHEVSNTAVACPNCGRPIAHIPVAAGKVVLPPRPAREGFPTWAFIPIGVLAVVIILVVFLLFGRNSENQANEHLRVNVNSERRSEPPTITSVPPSSSGGTTATSAPSGGVPSSETVVPGTQTTVTTPPDKGHVVIDAKIVSNSGAPRAVSNEKFYLLDQDIESILSSGSLEPINGQSMTDSLGLSMLYPDRYGDFGRKAMRLLAAHIKYSGRTDSSGKAQLTGVEPNSYYLFGMTHGTDGFAVWNSPVSVQAGDNVLNLTPQQMTRIDAG